MGRQRQRDTERDRNRTNELSSGPRVILLRAATSDRPQGLQEAKVPKRRAGKAPPSAWPLTAVWPRASASPLWAAACPRVQAVGGDLLAPTLQPSGVLVPCRGPASPLPRWSRGQRPGQLPSQPSREITPKASPSPAISPSTKPERDKPRTDRKLQAWILPSSCLISPNPHHSPDPILPRETTEAQSTIGPEPHGQQGMNEYE